MNGEIQVHFEEIRGRAMQIQRLAELVEQRDLTLSFGESRGAMKEAMEVLAVKEKASGQRLAEAMRTSTNDLLAMAEEFRDADQTLAKGWEENEK